MGWKRRLPTQLYHVIALTCRRRVSFGGAASFQFRVRGMERVVQRVRALGFVAISVHAPGSIAANENRQSGADNSTSVRRTSENVELAVLQKCLRDGYLTHRPDLQPRSPTTMCNLACDGATELTKARQTRAVYGLTDWMSVSSMEVKMIQTNTCFHCL